MVIDFETVTPPFRVRERWSTKHPRKSVQKSEDVNYLINTDIRPPPLITDLCC